MNLLVARLSIYFPIGVFHRTMPNNRGKLRLEGSPFLRDNLFFDKKYWQLRESFRMVVLNVHLYDNIECHENLEFWFI